VAGEFSTIGKARRSVPIQPGKWHRLRFELQGASLRGYIDGNIYLEVTDNRLKSGMVGLCRADARDPQEKIVWKDVRVEKLP
jgi:hypothetical protein